MPAMRPLFLLLSGAMLLAAATFAHAQTSESPAFQPMDVFQLQWADHPQLSPDGKTIVYERCWFDVMKDRKRSNLWIVGSDGRDNRPLTTGAANDGGATWSPDGKRLAWIAAEDGKSQIFVRWMDSGESAAITHLTQAPRGLSWSPDGKWIAFTMRVPAPDLPLAQMPAPPKGAEWAAPPHVINRVDLSHRRRRLRRSGLHACVRRRGRRRRAAPDHRGQAQFHGHAGVDAGQPRGDRGEQLRRRLGVRAARKRALSRRRRFGRDGAADASQGTRPGRRRVAGRQARRVARLRRQRQAVSGLARLRHGSRRRRAARADGRTSTSTSTISAGTATRASSSTTTITA